MKGAEICSFVESGGTPNMGAASEGGVKGVEDDSGEYYQDSKAIAGIPSRRLVGDGEPLK